MKQRKFKNNLKDFDSITENFNFSQINEESIDEIDEIDENDLNSNNTINLNFFSKKNKFQTPKLLNQNNPKKKKKINELSKAQLNLEMYNQKIIKMNSEIEILKNEKNQFEKQISTSLKDNQNIINQFLEIINNFGNQKEIQTFSNVSFYDIDEKTWKKLIQKFKKKIQQKQNFKKTNQLNLKKFSNELKELKEISKKSNQNQNQENEMRKINEIEQKIQILKMEKEKSKIKYSQLQKEKQKIIEKKEENIEKQKNLKKLARKNKVSIQKMNEMNENKEFKELSKSFERIELYVKRFENIQESGKIIENL
ncbi:hypothetical protein M0811_07392 [Anaeramoeba ignava]|uniref:Uncharacterized protein n=1 Tax=Anaeramoeba ignava TaxID=1746090 RepID=A0A9Q0LM47_ANAIG|nr:hypothetical protein M0811_07392 [Anaeramoeba ignava]